MKSNQSFIINSKTDNIKMLEKQQFVKELSGIIAKKNNKVLSLTEVKKMNVLSYTEIIQEFDNCFTKLTKGIYCVKIDTEKTLVCLIDKTIEDFMKIYEKNKKNKSKMEINNDKIDLTKSKLCDTKTNIINEARKIKVDKNIIKKSIRVTAAVLALSMVGLNSVACYKPDTEKIAIEFDKDLNTNEKKTTENEQTIKNYKRDYEAEKKLPSGSAQWEKDTWTVRNHKWAEPREEDKIYIETGSASHPKVWCVLYTYNGKEYWVTGGDTKDARAIYEKTSNNPKEYQKPIMSISPKVNEPIYNLLAELELGNQIAKDMRGGAPVINKTY